MAAHRRPAARRLVDRVITERQVVRGRAEVQKAAASIQAGRTAGRPPMAAILVARSTSAQVTTPTVTSDTRVRTLLSWLDDAEVLDPGSVEVSIATSRWSTQYGHETDAPTVFAAVGIAPRVQFAASGLHYSSAYTDGFTSSGRGDVYLMGKVAVISPREHPGGVAISPVLEILSDLSLAYRGAGASRVTWGLPVSLQYTATKVRVYGSTGYFSRGSVFGSAGVEAFVTSRVIVSGSRQTDLPVAGPGPQALAKALEPGARSPEPKG